MPVVTKRASEANLKRRSKTSLNTRRRLKATGSTDRIGNDENDGEVARGQNQASGSGIGTGIGVSGGNAGSAGNANKKAKTSNGRRALLEIAWWTVTPNLGEYLNTSDGHMSNSYILYSRSPTPSFEFEQRQHTQATPRPTISRASSMR